MGCKFKNILLTSILAVAGIFGVSSAIINNKVKEAKASTDVENTVGSYIYVEDQTGKSWLRYGNPAHLHMYNITFDANSGFNGDNLPTGGSGYAAFGAYLSKVSNGIYNCKLSGSNNDTHCWVNIPWYITSFDANIYGYDTTYFCKENEDTYSFHVNRGDTRKLYILGSGSGFNPNWGNDHKIHAKLSHDYYDIENANSLAKYTEKQYTVVINSNGGSALSDQSILHGGKIVNRPTKAGDTFKRYTSIAADDDDYVVNYVTSDFTAYAQWEGVSPGYFFWQKDSGESGKPFVNIHYWGNDGGTSWPGSTGEEVTVNGITMFYLEAATPPNGCLFNYDGDTKKTSDQDLTGDYAVRKNNTGGTSYYYDGNGGDHWNTFTIKISYFDQGGGVYSGSTIADVDKQFEFQQNKTLPTPTKAGYTFAGWYDNSSCTGSEVTSISAYSKHADQTFYAKWTANEYTITFSAGEGGEGGEISVTSYVFNPSSSQTVTISTEPTKDGHTPSYSIVRTGDYGNAAPSVSDLTVTIPANSYGAFTIQTNWTSGLVAAKAFAGGFNDTIEDACDYYGVTTKKKNVTDAWSAQATEYGNLKEYEIYWFTHSDDTDITTFRGKYTYVYNKYGTEWELTDFASGVKTSSAIRDFSPISISSLFGEEESLSTVIIIVASSVALLSVTALSILVIKKRKNKEE